MDKINPDYYRRGGVECIDAIKASMEPETFRGFLKGNVQKYVWRYENKNGVEDLRKAQWYLNRLLKEVDTGKPEETRTATTETAEKEAPPADMEGSQRVRAKDIRGLFPSREQIVVEIAGQYSRGIHPYMLDYPVLEISGGKHGGLKIKLKGPDWLQGGKQ